MSRRNGDGEGVVSRKFEDIAVGDQLEQPASAWLGQIYTDTPSTRDPNRPARVAIVTHIWHDPVESKDYVALALLRRDGSYGKPHEKRTVTGLARCGWEKASRDWIAQLSAVDQAGDEVVSLFGRRDS